MRTFAALLVLIGHCFLSHTAAAAQSQDCKLIVKIMQLALKLTRRAHARPITTSAWTIVGKNNVLVDTGIKRPHRNWPRPMWTDMSAFGTKRHFAAVPKFRRYWTWNGHAAIAGAVSIRRDWP